MKLYKIKVISILFLAVAVLILQGCGGKGDEVAPGTVSTDSAKAETHEETAPNIASLTEEQIRTVGIQLGPIESKQLTASIKANGALRVPNDSKGNATSLYGGVITSLRVQVGDYVKRGQVIATIANPQFIQLQEEYLTLDSRITLAQQELDRQQELNEGNAGARKNLQNATAELSALKTRKASLRQQIRLMGINPASVSNTSLRSALVVTSPIGGTVSTVFAKMGSYVDVSSPVIEVINNNELHLDLQVFEKDLPKMKVGQIVHFTLTNNPANEYDARVFSIGSSFESESKTVSVHCAVTGNKAGLIDGMNITGIVSLNNVTSAAIPDQAIVEADGKFYIFIQTDKEPEPAGHDDHGHGHDEAEQEHEHKNEKDAAGLAAAQGKKINFEKIEVAKGVSDLGYTAITPVSEVPADARVAVKGAFFINATLSNTGGHDH